MSTRARLLVSILAGVGFLAAPSPAQILSATVDILSPGDEGYDGIPPNLLVLDIFVDVAETDVWTAAGMAMSSFHGATFVYFDTDLNTPGTQPGLTNPGLENRFTTSWSKPRARNANARFENAGAAIAGAYSNLGAMPTMIPTFLDGVYYAYPFETPGSPSRDGYIARIALDLSATLYEPDDLFVTYAQPDFYLLSCGPPTTPYGFAWATFDVPQIGGMNFWISVPEPAPILAVIALVAAVCRSRGSSGPQIHGGSISPPAG